ncbi:hypothetical protein M433DRAFT_325843 [Acidomyces richmondensis BFW]|nr:hypothetical protein M433DRAFT_325843 [Acidomyces richmondensis BFW]
MASFPSLSLLPTMCHEGKNHVEPETCATRPSTVHSCPAIPTTRTTLQHILRKRSRRSGAGLSFRMSNCPPSNRRSVMAFQKRPRPPPYIPHLPCLPGPFPLAASKTIQRQPECFIQSHGRRIDGWGEERIRTNKSTRSTSSYSVFYFTDPLPSASVPSCVSSRLASFHGRKNGLRNGRAWDGETACRNRGGGRLIYV